MVKTVLHQKDHGYWIELIGNATETHTTEIPEDQLHSGQVKLEAVKTKETGEQAAYLAFVTS